MRYVFPLVHCLLALAVPLYDSDAPQLLGFPFLYWRSTCWCQSRRCLSTRSSETIARAARRDTPLGPHLNVAATSVFVVFFALVTVLGFVAGRWPARRSFGPLRMGPRRPLRRLGLVVPDRRRPFWSRRRSIGKHLDARTVDFMESAVRRATHIGEAIVRKSAVLILGAVIGAIGFAGAAPAAYVRHHHKVMAPPPPPPPMPVVPVDPRMNAMGEFYATPISAGSIGAPGLMGIPGAGLNAAGGVVNGVTQPLLPPQ